MTATPQNQTAFPLAWPNGWARFPAIRDQAPFWKERPGTLGGGTRRQISMAEATDKLIAERWAIVPRPD